MRNYLVDSVDAALHLLLILQRDERVRLSEVAEELAVARSTAHRLLSTLVARGFAVQDADRRYRLGSALGSPAHGTSGELELTEALREHLAWLNAHTGETVHLMVRSGRNVRFLESVEGGQALRVGSRAGVRLEAHRTSGGKALLAELDRDELATLYRDVGEVDKAKLVRVLAGVRRQGYALNTNDSEPGITAVGMVVRAAGLAVAAISVSAPSLRFPRSRIPETVRLLGECAREAEAVIQS